MTAPIVVGYDDHYIHGRYLDDQFFWPILECAEALNVPIYLHPTQPPKSVINASYSSFYRS
jgi:predicted TIM-barrel fold metal-dependent hydrolase